MSFVLSIRIYAVRKSANRLRANANKCSEKNASFKVVLLLTVSLADIGSLVGQYWIV